MLKIYLKYPRKCHKIEHLYLFDFRTLTRVCEMTTSINVLNSNTFFLRLKVLPNLIVVSRKHLKSGYIVSNI